MISDQLRSMGFEPEERRGKTWVCGNDVSAIVGGLPISFTRRRYGSATFCWAMALIAGEWVDLGDPWQKVTPSKKDIEEALEILREYTESRFRPN